MDKYIEAKRKIQEALRGKGYSNKSINLLEFNSLYEPYKDIVSEEIFSDFLGMAEKSLERLQKGITYSVIILKTDEPLLTRVYELQDLLRPLHTNELIDYEQFCRIFEPYKDEMNENSFSRILGLAQYTFLNMKKIKGKRGIIFKTPEVSQERMIEVQREVISKGYINRKISYDEFLELYEPYRLEMQDFEFAKITRIRDVAKLRDGRKQYVIIFNGFISLEREEKKDEIIQELKDQGYCNKHMSLEDINELYEKYSKDITFDEFIEMLKITRSQLSTIKNTKGRVIVLKTEKASEDLKDRIEFELRQKGYSNKLVSKEEFDELFRPYSSKLTIEEFGQAVGLSSASYGNLKRNRATILSTYRPTEERGEEVREELRNLGYEDGTEITYPEFIDLFNKYQTEMVEIEFAEVLGITYGKYREMKYKGKSIKLFASISNVPAKRMAEIRIDLRNQGYSGRLIQKNVFDELYEPYREELTTSDFEKVLMLNLSQAAALRKTDSKPATILPYERLSNERRNQIKEESDTLIGLDEEYINKEIFMSLYDRYKTEISAEEYAELLGLTIYAVKNFKNNPNLKLRIRGKKEEPKKVIEKSYRIQTDDTAHTKSQKSLNAKRALKKRIIEELKSQGHTNELVDYNQFSALYKPYTRVISETEFYTLLGISYSSFKNMKDGKKRCIILKENTKTDEYIRRVKAEIFELGIDGTLIDYDTFKKIYSNYSEQFSEGQFAKVLGIDILNNLKVSSMRVTLKKKVFKIAMHQLKNSREYSMEELEQICSKLDISVEELFQYLCGVYNPKIKDVKKVSVNSLLKKGKIYIGDIIPELKKRIIEELKSQGHTNELVDYNQFSALYKPYTRVISETEFYTLLGISYSSFKDLKDGKKRCIILKENTKTDEYIRRVKAEVFELGIDGTLIDYDTFKKIYSNYSEQFSEGQFAKVLGIDKLNNLKVSPMRVTLKKKVFKIAMHQLKNSREYSMEELEQICSKLDISVEELFQYLRGVYNPKIKDVKKVSVNSLLKKGKIYIGDITPELEDRIKTIAETNGYDGRLISNANVDRLFSDYYIVMSKSRLFQILGIADYYGTLERRRILLKKNQIKNALDELLEARYYTQEELRRVCSKNNLSVKELLQYLLGIHTKGIDDFKKINVDDLLKKDRLYLGEVTPEIKEIIVDEILKRGYDGKLIKLSELQKLYLPYRMIMSKFAFTQIIGASNGERDVSKKGDQMTRIVLKRRELENILSNLSTPRYYSHGELDDMCSQNGVSLEEFLQYYMANYKSSILDSKTLDVSELLKMDKIFFGVAPIPKEFLDNHMEEILTIGKKIENMLKRKLIKYSGNLIDVYTDAILDLIQKNGSLVYNSKDDDEAINRIKSYLKLSITGRYIRESKKTIMTSLDETIYDDDNEQTKYIYLASKEKTPEENAVEIVRNTLQEEKRIPHNTIMQILAETRDMYKKGYKYEDIVDEMQDKYGITPNELLKILKGELARKIEDKDPQK